MTLFSILIILSLMVYLGGTLVMGLLMAARTNDVEVQWKKVLLYRFMLGGMIPALTYWYVTNKNKVSSGVRNVPHTKEVSNAFAEAKNAKRAELMKVKASKKAHAFENRVKRREKRNKVRKAAYEQSTFSTKSRNLLILIPFSIVLLITSFIIIIFSQDPYSGDINYFRLILILFPLLFFALTIYIIKIESINPIKAAPLWVVIIVMLLWLAQMIIVEQSSGLDSKLATIYNSIWLGSSILLLIYPILVTIRFTFHYLKNTKQE